MSEPSSQSVKRSSSSLIDVRLKKLEELVESGIQPYSTGFSPNLYSSELKSKYAEISESEEAKDVVRLAGRIMAIRILGKASFMRLQDVAGDFQIYLGRDLIGVEEYKHAKKLDIGDIVGVMGVPFKTKTGELTVMVKDLTLLTKSMRPLPEKWHGLSDVEIRYRQRYLDLMVNKSSREIVMTRSRIVAYLRNFLTIRGYLEVETPMMQAIPGGATARPFETFHHALSRRLYLRIAPELYLKRLLVGGFDKVFEINRNFRNEGISTQHNPEFTMLEFYQAYITYEDLMDLTEEMLSTLAMEIVGSHKLYYGDREVDLTPPWPRITVKDSLINNGVLNSNEVEDRNAVFIKAVEMGIAVNKGDSLGKLLMAIFDEVVEDTLWGPVFVHHYPVEVSPLARRNEEDPTVTDRFELYVCGREMANAFTELTDPVDQRNRFEEQVRARQAGDEEAHFLDEDFLRALEYGMPPAAGEGLGIDRLVMLLTNAQSIREVILFPHMRPEKGLE
ncbi:MAG: lysine--tRNA ligase [Deltaproteobacteria bacterium]|nr:lysine--tRNA ligase [Deltaproteobacteria bacterium]